MNLPAAKPFFISAVSAFLIGLALVFVGLRVVRPFANDRLQPGMRAILGEGMVVTPLDEIPDGLRAGDLVTAVEGVSLADWIRQGRTTVWEIDQPVTFSILRQSAQAEVVINLSRYPLGEILKLEWGTLVYYFLYLLIAGIVIIQKPQLPAAQFLFLSASAQFGALPWSLGLHASDVAYPPLLWLYHLCTAGGFLLVWIASFHFALAFPRPAPILTRRWFVPVFYSAPYGGFALFLVGSGLRSEGWLEWMGRWGAYSGVVATTFLTGSILAVLWQYRHSRGPTRQQMRWLVWGVSVVASTAVLFSFLPRIFGFQPIDDNILGAIGVIFPLSIAVAILRHNLFDINILLNRTLVYGGLTGAVIAFYVTVVGVLGTLFQMQNNLFIALVGTGLVAVLFQPLRERLQKGVDRLLYGRRDEPFEVLAALGQRLESTLSPGMVYPTIVETVATALRLPYAAVALHQDGQTRVVHAFGNPDPDPMIFPLTHQGETVGELHAGRRAPNEPFSDADQRLLRNIARQAGAAVHTVRLMSDLQKSRQKLVTALEEERRRLRRDLHDGLGPHLASQTLTIDAIDKLLEKNPGHARQLLRDLKNQSRSAVQDIRRLVYGLRPPALDELGLVGALRESASRHGHNGLEFIFEARDIPDSLPAAVEVAAFYIVEEAVTNVVRHARANRCSVSLAIDRSIRPTGLVLTVTDNGQGMPAGLTPGVGLQSIRERTSALGGSWQFEKVTGGGCRLKAILPLANGHHGGDQ